MERLLVFDFDYSFIEADSDHFTLETLVPIEYNSSLAAYSENTVWTDFVNGLFEVVHSKCEINDLSTELDNILSRMPFSNAIADVVKAVGNTIIISDANDVFIQKFLQLQGLQAYIKDIVTNPAKFTADGRLEITRYSRRLGIEEVHNCSTGICSLNICKGKELSRYLAENQQIVYVGDGKNDYCPMTKLSSTDIAMIRRGRGLESLLEKRPDLQRTIRAKVVYWKQPEEIKEFLEKEWALKY